MWAPAKKKKLFVRPFSPPVCVCVLSLAAVFALPEQQFSLTPLLPISSMATVVVHGRDQRRGEGQWWEKEWRNYKADGPTEEWLPQQQPCLRSTYVR